MDLSECLAVLHQAGIKRVAVTWDSGDDEGWDGRGLRFFTTTGQEVTDTLNDVFTATGDSATDLYNLDDTLDQRFVDIRAKIDPDWDEEEGSRGRIVLHVLTGEVRVEYFKRIVAERQARYGTPLVEMDAVPVEIYRDPLTQPAMPVVNDDLAETLSEPVCECPSLMGGHDPHCAFWIAKQKST